MTATPQAVTAARAPAPSSPAPRSRGGLATLALFGGSGFVAVAYETLWFRELGVILGNSAAASALVLACFFLGWSIGCEVFGSLASHVRSPLRSYGVAHAAMAVAAIVGLAALAPLGTLDLGARIDVPILPRLLDAAVACVVVLVPAIVAGGSLPLVAEARARAGAGRGAELAGFYAVNTLFGAAGALVAGLVLPPVLGVRGAHLCVTAVTLLVAVAAWMLGRPRPEWPRPAQARQRHTPPAAYPELDLLALALMSGAGSLAVEVLCARMFAQVLHNSVYSFAVILAAFLVALACGAACAGALARWTRRLLPAASAVAAAAGIAVVVLPVWFIWCTDGLRYAAPHSLWPEYLWSVARLGAEVMLVPGICIGMLFPLLLKSTEAAAGVGVRVGRLAGMNTIGAMIGALAAGVVLLPHAGVWTLLRAVGCLYLLAAAVIAAHARSWRAGVLCAVGVLVCIGTGRFDYPLLRLDAAHGERLYGAREGAAGTVAVVGDDQHLRLRLDNYYALGGSETATFEETQADIPITLAARPRSVFFLGFGTGITAGAALRYPVEQVTATELVPEVVWAAREFFAPYDHGLFSDARVRIIADDGRRVLRDSRGRYDVIVGDLFIPWQAGTASLYTREHFDLVRSRLNAGGLFAQWLPLYQLSLDEFVIIARTLLSVFPQVTVWRGDFKPEAPAVALIASATPQPLDPDAVVRNFSARSGIPVERRQALTLMALFYAGTLDASSPELAAAPLNTDDRPLVEFRAPIVQRQELAGETSWFKGTALLAWYRQLLQRMPPDRDPFLARLAPEESAAVEAGFDLWAAKAAALAGRAPEAQRLRAAFAARVPQQVGAAFLGAAPR